MLFHLFSNSVLVLLLVLCTLFAFFGLKILVENIACTSSCRCLPCEFNEGKNVFRCGCVGVGHVDVWCACSECLQLYFPCMRTMVEFSTRWMISFVRDVCLLVDSLYWMCACGIPIRKQFVECAHSPFMVNTSVFDADKSELNTDAWRQNTAFIQNWLVRH